MANKAGDITSVDFSYNASANDQEPEGCAFIGEGVIFHGSIVVPGKLVVHGKIEGGEIGARELIVGRTGVVSGQVRADIAEVHGRIVENLEAKVRLSLRKSGSVEGSVAYGEIEIEKGGRLLGTVATLEATEDADSSGAESTKKFVAQLVANG